MCFVINSGKGTNKTRKSEHSLKKIRCMTSCFHTGYNRVEPTCLIARLIHVRCVRMYIKAHSTSNAHIKQVLDKTVPLGWPRFGVRFEY